jgi:CubicO group peptidase (beta-lactamase class C family)
MKIEERINRVTEYYLLVQLIIVIVVFLTSCSNENVNESKIVDPPPATNIYEPPDSLGDGWETEYMSEVNLNETPLLNMLDYINNRQDHKIHSILIIKDGKLVFEEYYSGYLYDSNDPGANGAYITYDHTVKHFEASVTKSVTSLLVGIAFNQGLITNLDNKLVYYYPEYSSVLTGQKANISLKHLITMTAGLAWDESSYPYGDPRNDVTMLFITGNPISFILNKDLETIPGTAFHYNSGYPNVLADIIRKTTSDNISTFANNNLFTPLQIDDYFWERIGGGHYFASGGIYLTPRSLAKLGYLYLNDGYWNDVKIISEDWINESKSKYISLNGWGNTNGYGYYWWLNSVNVNGRNLNYYYAGGWGEQNMFIIPAHNMLVVFNCGYFLTPITVSPFDLFHNYILKAIPN